LPANHQDFDDLQASQGRQADDALASFDYGSSAGRAPGAVRGGERIEQGDLE
jgi:hypothetical protein